MSCRLVTNEAYPSGLSPLTSARHGALDESRSPLPLADPRLLASRPAGGRLLLDASRQAALGHVQRPRNRLRARADDPPRPPPLPLRPERHPPPSWRGLQ